jgi:hypothetical protein
MEACEYLGEQQEQRPGRRKKVGLLKEQQGGLGVATQKKGQQGSCVAGTE